MSTTRRNTLRAIAGILYLVIMAAVVLGLRAAREWSQKTYAMPTTQSSWQEFREDVAKGSKQSPVQREVPQSIEPPALVLLRDYYWECTVISLVLTTALYGAMTFMVLGVLGNPPSTNLPSDPQ